MEGAEIWTPEIWNAINNEVREAAAGHGMARALFGFEELAGNPTVIEDESIDFVNAVIPEGRTKRFVELYYEFSATKALLKSPTGLERFKKNVAQYVKGLILAEDLIIFQGQGKYVNNAAAMVELPGRIKSEVVAENMQGLVADFAPNNADNNDPTKVSEVIEVKLSQDKNKRKDVIWGEQLFTAVASGKVLMSKKGQVLDSAPLVLSGLAFEDACKYPSNDTKDTTKERLEHFVMGGVYQAPALPTTGDGHFDHDSALLLGLTGNDKSSPVFIYIGQPPTIEEVRREGNMIYFRIVERFQYVVRDARAIVILKFAPKP